MTLSRNTSPLEVTFCHFLKMPIISQNILLHEGDDIKLHGNIVVTTSCLFHPCSGNWQNPSVLREGRKGGKEGRGEGKKGEETGRSGGRLAKKIPLLCLRLVHCSLRLEHCLLMSLRRLPCLIGLLPSQRNTTKTAATIATKSIHEGKVMCKGAYIAT